MPLTIPRHELLAVTTRGDHAENMHWGSAAVVNAEGALLASFGDASALTFARSTIKPFQALPFVRAGGIARFGWGIRETAMLCASHSAEAWHVDTVGGMLASAGNTIAELGCGAHVPMDYSTRCIASAADGPWSAIHNNCSGKHAGFLACCTLHGWTRADYLQPDHLLQHQIRQSLGEVAQVDVEQLPRGIDGCSAPIYALPLAQLAGAFARLARGQDAALATLRDAMRREPRFISGTGRFDLQLATYGGDDWVVKGGADGLQLLASVSRGVGVAVKVADGNLRALNAAVLAILRQLDWLTNPLSPALAEHDAPAIRNWRGTHTGDVLPCATLSFG